MMHVELELLMTGVGTTLPAQERLTRIADALVKKRIIREDAFWNSVDPSEQTLFAVCSVINVAGSSGFESFCQHFSGSALALLTCAERALIEMSEEKYAKTLQVFLKLCREHLLPERIPLPDSFSTTQRYAFVSAEKALYRTSFFKVARPRLRELDESILSCWDSTLPEAVLAWVGRRRQLFENVLCS